LSATQAALSAGRKCHARPRADVCALDRGLAAVVLHEALAAAVEAKTCEPADADQVRIMNQPVQPAAISSPHLAAANKTRMRVLWVTGRMPTCCARRFNFCDIDPVGKQEEFFAHSFCLEDIQTRIRRQFWIVI